MRQRPEIHAPYWKNMQDVYPESAQEMLTPYPAIALRDWPLWTRLTGGFRVREFTIFCGPTGCGKTTFLANLSTQLLKQGEKHFVMSVETGHTDFMKRIMSVFAGEDLNTGDAVDPDKLERLAAQHGRHLESDAIEFALYEDRLPVEQLMHDIEFMVKERGCKIAMIDNLNFFMDVTSSRDQVVEMDRVIHSLIVFCKKVDVHLIMVMHPKKTENGGRVESEFDIKGSSTAVQEAHNVFLFNRPRAEDVMAMKRERFDRELTLSKMRRRGQHVGSTLVFECQGTRYVEKGFA